MKARHSILKFLIKMITIEVIFGLLVIAGLFFYYGRDLPELFEISDFNPKQSTKIYDRNGHLLMVLSVERRTVIPWQEIPTVMRQAMIAAEDGNFYHHQGLDGWGILRAAYANISSGHFSQGASTITQQVVKNLMLTPERTLKRKIQEVLLARKLDAHFSKDDILWMYLNYVYFGHGRYGIEEAAHFFFHIHAKDLNLEQAALLAGLVQSPERLSPIKHPKRAKKRRNYVLRQMRKHGMIDEASYHRAINAPIVLNQYSDPYLGKAPYFTEYIRQKLIQEYGKRYTYSAGLKVYTTLDLKLQFQAEEALRQGLKAYDKRQGFYEPIRSSKVLRRAQSFNHGLVAEVISIVPNGLQVELKGKGKFWLKNQQISRINPEHKLWSERFKIGDKVLVSKDCNAHYCDWARGPNGALILIDSHTREVQALVGGYDFHLSAFNRAIQAKRQSGSAIKVVVFGSALESKLITPATLLDDIPKSYPIPGQDKPWSPQNFDRKYKGTMTARKALALSRNTIAVEVLNRVGIEQAKDFARRIGIHSPLPNDLTLALGSGEVRLVELTNAFGTFASGGLYQDPIFISEIKDGRGRTIFKSKAHAQRVLDEGVAFLMTSMLHSVTVEGTAKRYLKKWKHYAAGKTGTTNKAKDAWFIGYTAYWTAGVYVGFDQPQSLGKREGASRTALPIWAQLMKEIHQNLAIKPFDIPSNIEVHRIVPQSGLLEHPDHPHPNARVEYFLLGTAPTQYAPLPDEIREDDWMIHQYEP